MVAVSLGIVGGSVGVGLLRSCSGPIGFVSGKPLVSLFVCALSFGRWRIEGQRPLRFCPVLCELMTSTPITESVARRAILAGFVIKVLVPLDAFGRRKR